MFISNIIKVAGNIIKKEAPKQIVKKTKTQMAKEGAKVLFNKSGQIVLEVVVPIVSEAIIRKGVSHFFPDDEPSDTANTKNVTIRVESPRYEYCYDGYTLYNQKDNDNTIPGGWGTAAPTY